MPVIIKMKTKSNRSNLRKESNGENQIEKYSHCIVTPF